MEHRLSVKNSPYFYERGENFGEKYSLTRGKMEKISLENCSKSTCIISKRRVGFFTFGTIGQIKYCKISWWFDSCDANESNSSTWQIDMTLFVFILLPEAKVLSIQLSLQYFWSVTCTNMTIPTYTHYTIHKSVE